LHEKFGLGTAAASGCRACKAERYDLLCAAEESHIRGMAGYGFPDKRKKTATVAAGACLDAFASTDSYLVLFARMKYTTAV